jgi:hypothetical protein
MVRVVGRWGNGLVVGIEIRDDEIRVANGSNL